MTRLKRKKNLHGTKEDVRFGTPIEVALYRANRLAGYDTIIEVGAGAGFQTNAFAKSAHVIAIDIDTERLSRAKFPSNVTVIIGDALSKEVVEKIMHLVRGKTAVFLDPERPPAGERTLSQIKPDIRKFIETYRKFSNDIAIELPPFLQDIPFECEREYISIDGRLNRLTIYFGNLKKDNISVVQLPSGNRVVNNKAQEPSNNDVLPRYILEPDAALEHAGLSAMALNIPYRRITLGKKSAYLTEELYNGSFFKTYKIIGINSTEKHLRNCGTLILHGSMSEEEQRRELTRLNRLCKGKKRLHLFIADKQYITMQITTRE